MKKLSILLLAALAALMTLTSCDKDNMQAWTLDGTWTGYIDTYYADRWGWTGESYNTSMFFNKTNTYGGNGYQVDYNVNDPYRGYYYCDFVWDVRNGVIYIDYADSWNTVRIYDYTLNSSRFAGFMDDGTHRDIRFSFVYNGRFDWGRYRGGYYYAPEQTRGTASADSTVLQHEGAEPVIMTREDGTEVLVGNGFQASGEFLEALKAKKQVAPAAR